MMVDLDDDESALAEWSVADEAEEDDCDANTVAGENAIDRFACAVGGKTMLPHIMSTVPPMLQNSKDLVFWLRRRRCWSVGRDAEGFGKLEGPWPSLLPGPLWPGGEFPKCGQIQSYLCLT